MCGIAGLYHRNGRPASRDTGEAMSLAIGHRGPDGHDSWADGPVAFGHRRLAIRDLSPAGRQPLSDPTGQITIAYNGEIYNDAELRRELARDFGCSFRSTCDSETIPLAYLAWGEAAFARFEGMFAFALWDSRKQCLFLVRDGIGIKPLFYSDHGNTIRFASEIKGLLADPDQPCKLSPTALNRYFAMGYVGPTETTIESIRQIPPGTYLRFDKDGMSSTRFWLPSRDRTTFRDENEALDAFLPIWEKVVDDTMISDVPVGVLQSGGIDSTLVTLTAARRHRVPLFTAGFLEHSHDETSSAKEVAAATGLPHTIVPIDSAVDLETTLEGVVHHFDGQVCDESALPLFMLLREVRRHVTVALSGDGGDEFFGGYSTYRASRAAAIAGALVPRPLATLIGRVAYSASARNESRLPATAIIARFAMGLAAGRTLAHTRWRRLIPAFQQAEVFGEALRPTLGENPFAEYEDALSPDSLPLIDRCLLADQKYYLPGGLLMKTDAMSMAHGLELRVPLLDRRVMDFAGQCATSLLAPAAGPTKRLLRSALRRYHAPRRVIEDRKKGFNAPLARILRSPLAGLAERHFVIEADRLAPFLSPAALARFWQEHRDRRANHAYTLWPILKFAIWQRQLEQRGRRL